MLIQFPDKIGSGYFTKVEQILRRVQQRNENYAWKTCVEFRHSSWYNKATVALLNKLNATMVMYDMPGSSYELSRTTAPFVYMRFHGLKGDYRGSYDTRYLDKIVAQISALTRVGKDVYVYFNNTMGDAFNNARYMVSGTDGSIMGDCY